MCIKIVLNNDIKQNAYSRGPFSKRNDETIQEMTALYSDLPLLFQSSRQQHTVVGCARAARRQPERAAAERTMRILSSTNTKRDENRSKKRNDLQSQQAHIPFALHRPDQPDATAVMHQAEPAPIALSHATQARTPLCG